MRPGEGGQNNLQGQRHSSRDLKDEEPATQRYKTRNSLQSTLRMLGTIKISGMFKTQFVPLTVKRTYRGKLTHETSVMKLFRLRWKARDAPRTGAHRNRFAASGHVHSKANHAGPFSILILTSLNISYASKLPKVKPEIFLILISSPFKRHCEDNFARSRVNSVNLLINQENLSSNRISPHLIVRVLDFPFL